MKNALRESNGAMKPLFYDVIGNEFTVVWDDQHESYYPLEQLRRACPCASCSGEPDLFGRVARGPEQKYTARSFELNGVDPIGNYGLQMNWADGHIYGIWTFDGLRKSCPCETCRR